MAKNGFIRRSSHARSAAPACRNSSRARFPSTVRMARVRSALGPGSASSRVTNKVHDLAKSLRAKLSSPWEKLPLATREAFLTCIVGALNDIYRDAPEGYGEWLSEY